MLGEVAIKAVELAIKVVKEEEAVEVVVAEAAVEEEEGVKVAGIMVVHRPCQSRLLFFHQLQ